MGLLGQIAYRSRHYLCVAPQNTALGVASPLALGVHDFKVARVQYLKAKLRAYLESSNGVPVATFDVYRLDGTAANTTITGSVLTTSSTASGVLYEADLTTVLQGTYDGALEGRLWCAPITTGQVVICRSAWIDYE